jgi:predicted kinase
MVGEDEDYFARENEVFDAWIFSIQAAIANDAIENVYIDATHINDNSRNKVLSKLNLEDVDLCAVNFIIPLGECLRRNDLREGRAKVPRGVIRRMYCQFHPVTSNYKDYTEIIDITE